MKMKRRDRERQGGGEVGRECCQGGDKVANVLQGNRTKMRGAVSRRKGDDDGVCVGRRTKKKNEKEA